MFDDSKSGVASSGKFQRFLWIGLGIVILVFLFVAFR
jgi:hypothetical protein